MKIQFTTQIFREGKMYVAYSPELDVSSCATTKTKAQKNLLEAVRLFLEEAEKKGSLDQILKESGFVRRKQILVGPRPLTTRRVTVPLSTLHA
jgi:predicted RNase H-like HicB family nuclease